MGAIASGEDALPAMMVCELLSWQLVTPREFLGE